MVMRRERREAMRAGRDAMLAARLEQGPSPENPFTPGTKRALYFDWGAERAGRLLDQLEEIGR